VLAVLFDLGGVLIEWDPRRLYRAHFDDEADLERFLAEVCTPAWNHGIDLGLPLREAVAERQAAFPEHAGLIALYDSGWPTMLGEAILGWFDRVIISGDVGLAKPDPAIFSLALAACGLEARETVFIDDAPANVAVARELGLDAILFQGPDRLREALSARGLVSPRTR